MWNSWKRCNFNGISIQTVISVWFDLFFLGWCVSRLDRYLCLFRKNLLPFFFFWLHCVWNPPHPALKVWVLNYWTTKEVCCCFCGPFKNTLYLLSLPKEDSSNQIWGWVNLPAETCWVFPKVREFPLLASSPAPVPLPVSFLLSSSLISFSTSSFLPFVLLLCPFSLPTPKRTRGDSECLDHPSSSCWVILLQVCKNPDSDCVSGDACKHHLLGDGTGEACPPICKYAEFLIMHWLCCVLRISERQRTHCPGVETGHGRPGVRGLVGWLVTPSSFHSLPYLYGGASPWALMRIRWST